MGLHSTQTLLTTRLVAEVISRVSEPVPGEGVVSGFNLDNGSEVGSK